MRIAWAILLTVMVAGTSLRAMAETAGEEAPAPPVYFENHVHLSLDGGPSPFLAVVYAVRTIGETTVAVQTKQYPQVPVRDNRVALLTTAGADAFYQQLLELGALELPDGGTAAPAALTWRVEVGIGGKAHAFTVSGAELLEDLRYAKLVELVQGVVESLCGPALFRDLLVAEEELGLLNLRTNPPVLVEVNGIDTGRFTPLYSFELPAGNHTATLRTPDGSLVRHIKFLIGKGKATNLNLNLRRDDGSH